LRKSLFISILFLFFSVNSYSSEYDIPFNQEIQKNILIPNSSNHIVNILKFHNAIFAVSTTELFKFNQGKWEAIINDESFVSANSTNNNLLLGGVGKIWSINKGYIKTEISVPTADSILAVLGMPDTGFLAGTANGLYQYTNKKWIKIHSFENLQVNSLLNGNNNEIWAATNSGLFHFKHNSWINLDEFVMAPGLLAQYTSLSQGTDLSQILFGGPFALGCIAENGNHWLTTGGNGLPYGPVTCIEQIDEEIWIGTPKGAAKKVGKNWHFYNGKRWLPNNYVNDILAVDENRTWIATPDGISEISSEKMTLEEKIIPFEKRIKTRHNRYGQVANSHLTRSGDVSTNKMYTNDNDGLWSAIYLAAESFRYASTGEQEAYDNAVRTFLAMERLETTTPISGFPARSFAKIDEDIGTHGEWHPTPDGQWKWKGDTSSDEIVGHMFAFPLFYDLVATGEMKERCRNLVFRIMTHIVDNEFRLVDLDGKPTRWGVWNPDSLNNRTDWWYERGINSLQILSFLKAASHMTGNNKFEKAYRHLINDHGYAKNMVQQKMYGPFEINHSDDELAFLPYYILLRYAEDPELLTLYQKSLDRSWQVEKLDRNPLWNYITSASLEKDYDLDIAIDELRLIPMDMIDWRVENSFRWDIKINPMSDRFKRPQSVIPVLIKERAVSKWNSNPYRLDDGGNGNSEDDGAYFLLPYWMGRYYKFILK
jgi:hypothetical protein